MSGHNYKGHTTNHKSALSTDDHVGKAEVQNTWQAKQEWGVGEKNPAPSRNRQKK